MKQILIFTFLSLLIVSSCVVSKEQVGNYSDMEGTASVYEKNKDFYLFWDLLPVKRIEKKLKITDYEIVYKRSFFDALIYGGTLGLFSYYTVIVKTKGSEEDQDKSKELNK